MRDTFVETENVLKFYAALSEFEMRGAREACMVVVDGQPGLGKTSAMSRWVAQNNAVYMRAQPGWDGSMFIHNLLRELGEETPRRRAARFELVIDKLSDRWDIAQLQHKPFGLVIDEVDTIITKRDVMETIRGISDMIELPTVLVGMGTIRDQLKRYPQINSRAPRRVRFEPATLLDTRRLVDERCEIKVADCLVAFIHRASQGFNREIVEAIASIERFGQRIDIADGGITMADMAGEKLMNDRNTASPIYIPGAR